MSDMIIDDNDTFLPTDSDKLKAQIKLLKERLTRATEKQKKLKKELLEEDISYLVVSKLTNAFTDPTVVAKKEMSNAKQEIFRQMREAAYVSRREQINEVANLSKEYDIKILTENKAKSHFEMKAHINHHTSPILISMDYANKDSAYPTQIKLTDERGTVSLNEYQETEELLLTSHHLADTLRSILQRIEI
ncbi:hypothetical protein RO3G_04240 [Rhizopus delemar RA 99-880]|uniref:Uncharacterized protein n=1 Tax=Rhizopus delemar (strain RA 99-880 / ATCC MYA-4621 / FGSC 9543 / NRRL 43880) TaxID=246409 RepID=I1BTK5_RHIO9|nr:hypothetical protein RO3G_04240 [Rhizopus delemar RA 99-880]|eukprot:EIE79535.1 hypothetical protein RO3G_04240 [Rhizopus delemar RA 99-880]